MPIQPRSRAALGAEQIDINTEDGAELTCSEQLTIEQTPAKACGKDSALCNARVPPGANLDHAKMHGHRFSELRATWQIKPPTDMAMCEPPVTPREERCHTLRKRLHVGRATQ